MKKPFFLRAWLNRFRKWHTRHMNKWVTKGLPARLTRKPTPILPGEGVFFTSSHDPIPHAAIARMRERITTRSKEVNEMISRTDGKNPRTISDADLEELILLYQDRESILIAPAIINRQRLMAFSDRYDRYKRALQDFDKESLSQIRDAELDHVSTKLTEFIMEKRRRAANKTG